MTPSLSLHQCGLPREIAIELFLAFVIRGLIRQHLASNIGVSKSKIREKSPSYGKYFRIACRSVGQLTIWSNAEEGSVG
ncbi:hypothetical protein LIER_00532 [Lithospermum erythrorhizon]|uniref:Uncharacterized protein n=1 Tax=Lithospermum erythrorhizon TaxID=34254 RepID=A0AAV3NIY6_LITER